VRAACGPVPPQAFSVAGSVHGKLGDMCTAAGGERVEAKRFLLNPTKLWYNSVDFPPGPDREGVRKYGRHIAYLITGEKK